MNLISEFRKAREWPMFCKYDTDDRVFSRASRTLLRGGTTQVVTFLSVTKKTSEAHFSGAQIFDRRYLRHFLLVCHKILHG